MLKRMSLLWLILAAALLLAGRAHAQDAPAAPAAIRLRVAHLAPFPGSGTADVSITVNGAVVAANLAFGGRTDYQAIPGDAGAATVEVRRDGTAIHTQAVTLIDGDQSLVFIGDTNLVPLAVWVIDDTRATPPPGQGELRLAHAAAIGATIPETLVDVCSQDGQPFQPGSNGLRYFRTTAYRQLPAAEYDLKITRRTSDTACAGSLLLDLPPWPLPEGTATTLYLVGDGVNQALNGFTFADGLLMDEPPPPVESRAYIPALLR
jgi:hypothetical protein